MTNNPLMTVSKDKGDSVNSQNSVVFERVESLAELEGKSDEGSRHLIHAYCEQHLMHRSVSLSTHER